MFSNTAILGSLLFCLFKVPMLFVVLGPEEMRDLDGYLQVSQGFLPYRDFSWLYGPLPSLIYGNLLRVLPGTVLSIRSISLLFWGLEVYFLIKILCLEIKSRNLQLGLGFLVSLAIGYPAYAHNHVVAAAFLAGMAYFLFKHEMTRQTKDVFLSFLCLFVVILTRPLLMGYGVGFLWSIYFLSSKSIRNKRRLGFQFVLIGIGIFSFAYLVWGKSLKMAFIPSFWYSQAWTGYPSIRYLLPDLKLLSDADYLIKYLKGATDLVMFYGHYFIWPTVVMTLHFTQPENRRFRLVMWLSLFSLAASSDVLFYGYQNPIADAKMGHRAQYFIAIELVAWALIAIGILKKVKFALAHSILVGQLSAIIIVWSVLPYLNGVFQLVKFRVNPFNVLAQTGLAFHPRDTLTMEVARFINSLCQKNQNWVLTSGYDPLLSGTLQCNLVAGRDIHLFIRPKKIVLGAFDSPYLPKGGVTSEELLEQRLKESPPTIVVGEGAEIPCNEVGWQYKDFNDGILKRRVCWKERKKSELDS